MDCVRTAVRAGADEVSCVYRRRVADMTALDAEIESAIAEGVEMITLESPDSIETNEAGQVVALITQPQMISAVKGGRPSVKAADKPKRRIEADVILVAVGQGIESQPFEDAGMLAEWGEFKANEFLEAQGENGTLARRVRRRRLPKPVPRLPLRRLALARLPRATSTSTWATTTRSIAALTFPCPRPTTAYPRAAWKFPNAPRVNANTILPMSKCP